jgi:RHS repeat-associated protein
MISKTSGVHRISILILMLYALSMFSSKAHANPISASTTVQWINLTGVSISGNILTKTSGTGWNAGAISSNILAPNTDGWLEFTAASGVRYLVGFATNNTFSNVDFENGLNVTYSGNSFNCYEGSTSTAMGTWAAGDVFRISREGSSVKYYKNGTVIRTVSVNAGLELKVKASLYDTGKTTPIITTSFDAQLILKGTVTGTGASNGSGAVALTVTGGTTPYTHSWSSGETSSSISGKNRGSYTVTVTDAAGRTQSHVFNIGYKDYWINVIGAAESGGILTRNIASSAWGNSGGVSSNVLTANTDGWMEFSGNSGDYYIIGFASTNLISNIEFTNGIYINYDLNTYTIYEGATTTLMGSWITGDVFRISREGSIVKYYRNGTVVRSVNVDPSLELKLKSTIYLNGKTTPLINASFDGQIILSGTPALGDGNSATVGVSVSATGGTSPYSYSWSSGEITNTINGKSRDIYTLAATDAAGHTQSRAYNLGYSVHWVNVTGATESNGVLTKTAPNGWVNGGAVSSNGLSANANGCIEFSGIYKAYFIIGFATNNTISSTDFTNGIYLNYDANIFSIFEGSTVIAKGGWQVGDVFKIKREGSFVKYYRNNQEVQSTPVDASLQLKAKTSIYISGQTNPIISASTDGQILLNPTFTTATGTTATGGASLNVNGGTAPYTYSWSTGETATAITNKVFGNYTVTVTDAKGRSNTSTLYIPTTEGLVPDALEFQALKDLFDNTAGSSWTTKTNWPTTGSWPTFANNAQFGTWYGVTVTNGDITTLNLPSNNLTGPLPTSIGNLTKAQYLYLNNNKLSGSIPSSIGNMTTLIKLYLNSNQLTGSIPSSIGALNKVTHLYLQLNKLTGSAPSEVGNMTLLQSLYLNNNQLSGTVPSNLSSLSNLAILYLYSNQLTGSLPSLSNLVNLTNIDCSGNQLTGMGNFTNLPNLTVLDLSSNALTSIDPSVWNLTKLSTLTLSTNQITGTLPDEVGNLTELTSLFLHINNLSGTIPSSIGNLTKLTNLYLYQNQLTGEIPYSIGKLSNLLKLYLESNKLTGTIPASIGKLSKLQILEIQDNQLTGSIPYELGGLSELTYFYAFDNQLSGSLPSSLGDLTKLKYFFVLDNQLSGEIPASFSALTQLVNFHIYHNQFTGNFPDMSGWTKITSLQFHDNQFSGDFPTSIGGATALVTLRGDNNNFTSLPSTLLNLPALNYLNFQYNDLVAIPNLASHPNKANLNVYLQHNYLDFTNWEPIFGNTGVHGIKSLFYSPQNLFGESYQPLKMYPPAGTTLSIKSASGGQYNTFTWEKKVTSTTYTSVNTSNQDATQKCYKITNVTNAVNGTYHWKISNSKVPTLILQSEDIDVIVMDALADNTSTRALYNGLISAARWRTDAANNTKDGELKGVYLYDYDEKYQIKEALYGDPNYIQNNFILKDNMFRLTNMSYDPNGNIKTLKRYDKNGFAVNDFNYTYATNKNQLTSVSNYTNAYTYNAIGQMIGADKNEGEDQYIDYDVSGKVRFVYLDANKTQKKIENIYDDRGFRLAKKVYTAQNQVSHITWYIRDASGNVLSIYEEDKINGGQPIQTEVPIYGSGKLGTFYPQQNESSNYELTDHLGNVRALVRDDVAVYTATMEDNGQGDITNPRVEEMQYFSNLFETEKVVTTSLNHTDSSDVMPHPKYASYLDGTAGKIVGPAITLKVSAGDVLNMKTYGVFEDPTDYQSPVDIVGMVGALTGTYLYTTGMESLTTTTQIFNNGLGIIGARGDDGTARPQMYLNYILFDQDFHYMDSKADRISTSAGFLPGQESIAQFDELKLPELKITQPGFIYIYVSNETPGVRTWFDDLTVEHHKTLVTESTDYGVWGDVLRSSSSPAPVDNSSTLKKSLVAQYLFNSNALDLSGNGLNGMVIGATLTTDKEGNANAAYNFDGVDDNIILPGTQNDLSFIQNTGIFTIAAYIKLSDLSARSSIIGSASYLPHKGFGLTYENFSGYGNHQLRFTSTYGNSSSYNNATGAVNTIHDNAWHHVTVVGDGTNITFYVDGVKDGNSTVISYYSSGDATYPAIIGGNNTSSGALVLPMHGSIDELHIFNRALTPAEINLLVQKKDVETSTGNLTAYKKYRFGYQGQYAEKDDETGWNHFELREYDPTIARWIGVDPKRIGWSPYIGMYNDPVNEIDADGGGPNGFVRNNETKKYSYDPNAKSQETTAKGYTYVGESTADVFRDFEANKPLWGLAQSFRRPDVDRTGWPGEAKEPVFKRIIGEAPDVGLGRAAKTTVVLFKEGEKIVAKNANQVPKIWKAFRDQFKRPTSTEVGKPFQEVIEHASGVPIQAGPKSFWQKVKEIIAVGGQYF